MDNIDELLASYSERFKNLSQEVINRIIEQLEAGIPLDEILATVFENTEFFIKNRALITETITRSALAGLGTFSLSASVSGIATILLSRSWTGDGMRLSDRLHSTDSTIRQRVRDTILASMNNMDSAIQMSRRLYDGYGHETVINQAELPKYLRDIATRVRMAADSSDEEKQAILKDIDKIRKQVGKLETPALQAAYGQLLDRLEKFKPEAIERAVHTALEERSRYYAERIARTETARAWFDGNIARYADNDDVWGYKWELSTNHPIYDQCDVCANADLGYGKGLYPKRYMPTIPRHPHCRCSLTPVFTWQVNANRSPNPDLVRNYLDNLPTKQKQALFGKEGLQRYQQGEDWQKLLRGWEGYKNPQSRLENIIQEEK